MKKQLLTTLTAAAAMTAGLLASPASALIFGSGDDASSIDANSQLEDVYHVFGGDDTSNGVTLDSNQSTIVQALAYEVGGFSLSPLSILEDPDQISILNNGGASVDGSGAPPSGFGVYSKGGCSIDAGCGFGAIGVKISLVCAAQVPANYGEMTDPEAWANCIKDQDYDAYMAAASCTYGTCPGFASAESEELYACNTGGSDSVMAMFN
ncbi:MAG: hypothetical protein ACFB9N_11600 [Geitlerinemataceae cyanobacterium]